jgi:hypothetical protein
VIAATPGEVNASATPATQNADLPLISMDKSAGSPLGTHWRMARPRCDIIAEMLAWPRRDRISTAWLFRGGMTRRCTEHAGSGNYAGLATAAASRQQCGFLHEHLPNG